ncbi:MAG: hypothetical protein O3C21_00800 [Verrucomicrobia bacterium]|nr:hypothetical protein [Verrucomicrobiota bacterium]
MSRETVDRILEWVRDAKIQTVDLTGGAPEMIPDFRYLVDELARGWRLQLRLQLRRHFAQTLPPTMYGNRLRSEFLEIALLKWPVDSLDTCQDWIDRFTFAKCQSQGSILFWMKLIETTVSKPPWNGAIHP